MRRGPPLSRSVLPPWPVLMLMLTASVIMALTETTVGYHIVHLDGLIDPDSYMRIVRIRDGLHAGWFTHVVTADNGGKGTVIYWSHLIDAIVLALRAPLRLFLNDQAALFVAAATTGPIFAALLAAVLVWAPSPLVHPHWPWLWTAPLAALLSPAIFIYGLLGYVHYHLPLILMAALAAACAGRATTGRADAGFWCGISSAVGIWLSPEALPYVLMAMGAIGVAWCLRPAALANALKACGAGFGAATAAAVLIDPPYGGWLSPEIDCISIVYAVLAALICGAAWLLIPVGRYTTSVWTRSFGCLLICLAIMGLWLWFYPSITHGLGGLVPPADTVAFFGAITEMQPVGGNARGIGLLMTGMLAVLSAIGLAWHRRSILWAYAAICGVVVVVLAEMYIRFLGYSEAIGALMLPVTVVFVGSLQNLPDRRPLLRLAAVVVFLFGPVATLALAGKENRTYPLHDCHLAKILPILRQEKHAIVLTEISDTPEILWRAPVRTVGSLYHKSIEAFMRARNAWRTGPSDGVPQAVLATGATHILACDLTGRWSFISDLPPSTLQDRLARHDVPSWLHEVGHGGGYYLYRIDRKSSGSS